MAFTFTRHKDMPDVLIIEGQRFNDDRGYFEETFRSDEFMRYGIPALVQENHSCSKRGVFRGLHYQLNPKAQGKLVSVVSGKAIDYIADIRQGSPTYGQHISVELSGKECKFVWVPTGFAHGFYSRSDNTHLMYKVSEYYSKENERSIRWNDPDIGIKITTSIELADKDRNAPLLNDADNNFEYKPYTDIHMDF